MHCNAASALCSSLDPPKERKRVEAAECEAEGQAAQAAEAARRADRLAGESGELQAALEQKQELIAALQVGRAGGEVDSEV